MKTRGKALFIAVFALASIALPVRAGVGEHCASRLVPLEPVGGVTSADLELIGCFGTYGEALEAGSGGSMDVAPTVTPETLTDEAVSLIVTASVLIGTEYDGFGYGGDSHSYFAPATCSAGVIWQVANVGATWNDRFQSGKGFGGCDTNRKFQHADFGGAVKTCTPNCTDYGSLANQVSSLRWRP